MAQNNLSIIGAGGVKNLVSLGDFDQWIEQRVNDRFSGGGDIAKYYQAVPWLFRGTMLRAQAIASFPFDIVAAGSTEPLDPETYADVLDFIPDLTTKLWLLEASLTLTGKAYLRNLRNRIYIKEVRYYAPTTITPRYDKQTGELVGYVRKANGKTVELTPEEITAFWYPDPFAEIGEPTHYPAQAARAASGVMFNLDLFAELFFGRGAVKASVISAKGNTQQKERDRLKEWFQSLFTGIQNAHTVEVLNADAVTITTVGEGVKELENTNLSQEKREDIAAALTIPQTMLFSGSAAGLGGGEVTDADDIRFVNEFKIPEITFIATHLNRGVLVPNGYRMIPRPERLDALHEDEAALAETATSYADLKDKCETFEEWDALASLTGFEYDETKWKKVFALKESRRVEQQAAESARLEAQARMQPANMTVTKPEPPMLEAGKSIGGGNGVLNGNSINAALGVVSRTGDDGARAANINVVSAGNSADVGTAGTIDPAQNIGEPANSMGVLAGIAGDAISETRQGIAGDRVDQAAKNLERKQYRTWAAKASNAGKVFRFAYLNEDEQAELLKKNSVTNVKSIDAVARQFCARWKSRIKGAFEDDTSNLDADLRAILEYHVTSAYTEGLIEAGVSPEDFTDEDTQAADTLYLEQTEHLAGFVEAILEAVENIDARAGVLARADLWCNSIQQIGDNARNAATDGMFEFVLTGDASEESCETCQKLLGKKHRWSWVVKNGYEVQAGNDNFECGCFNCPHSWEPVGKGG